MVQEDRILPIRLIMFWPFLNLRGAPDVRASDINEEMKVAAAYAIASLFLNISCLKPIYYRLLDEGCTGGSGGVADAARKSGSQVQRTNEEINTCYCSDS